MSLQSRTIAKLMRENFSGDAPIAVHNANREQVKADLTAHLTGLPNVEIDKNHYYSSRDDEEFILGCTIKNQFKTHRYYGDSNSFRMLVSPQGKLTISTWGNSAPISMLDEITTFAAAVETRYERQSVLRTKRGKVRNLKSQAIIAQVKRLAKEGAFDYATETDTQKLKLYVRLSDADCIEFHIPFNRFEDILPQLRTSIQSVRELYDQGIKFKMRAVHKIRWRAQWVEHDTLT